MGWSSLSPEERRAALTELTACRDYITTLCMTAHEAERPDPDAAGVGPLHPGEVLAELLVHVHSLATILTRMLLKPAGRPQE
ncbi:hypothetical protein GCM10025786_36450 [Nocardioides caeni]